MSQQPIVECVPNFSEGRNLAVIKEITDVIEAVADVRLLDVDPGANTNRTVVTFVGPPEAVEEAAFRCVEKAAQVIDMSAHSGEHPRMGATDVLPFVPVAGVSMEDCAEMARRVGKRIGDELDIPVAGRNLMVAVDLSGSMDQKDFELGNRRVDRLTATKAVAGDFISRREGDRIGLILFGERAYLQVPLTLDRETVKVLLMEAFIGLAGEKTAIGDAITLAVKRIHDQAADASEQVLVLLTGGRGPRLWRSARAQSIADGVITASRLGAVSCVYSA